MHSRECVVNDFFLPLCLLEIYVFMLTDAEQPPNATKVNMLVFLSPPLHYTKRKEKSVKALASREDA
jgi:hypothetical protein